MFLTPHVAGVTGALRAALSDAGRRRDYPALRRPSRSAGRLFRQILSSRAGPVLELTDRAIPLWVGEAFPAVDLAARLAGGWNTTPVTLDELRNRLALLDAALAKAGARAATSRSVSKRRSSSLDLPALRRKLAALAYSIGAESEKSHGQKSPSLSPAAPTGCRLDDEPVDRRHRSSRSPSPSSRRLASIISCSGS